jgi:hypothetical protein
MARLPFKPISNQEKTNMLRENAPGPETTGQTRQAKEAGTFQRSGGKVHVKLNGVPKTLPLPVTGEALHRLAGYVDGHPVSVSGVPNNSEPLEVKDGQEFTTALGVSKPVVPAPVPVKTEPVVVKTDPELA